MTNFRAPPSNASSAFCFSSWRLPTMSCPSTATTTTPRLSFVRLKLIPPPASRARLQHGDHRRVHNIAGRGASRQVSYGSRQPLQDRPDRLPAAQPLHQFVCDVAAVKVGEHEHVGTPRGGG